MILIPRPFCVLLLLQAITTAAIALTPPFGPPTFAASSAIHSGDGPTADAAHPATTVVYRIQAPVMRRGYEVLLAF
jgi:hypothetical protein